MILAAVIIYSLMIALELGGIMVAKYKLDEEYDMDDDFGWTLCTTAFLWPITMLPTFAYYLIRIYFYRKDME